jgi:hypothetical protein
MFRDESVYSHFYPSISANSYNLLQMDRLGSGQQLPFTGHQLNTIGEMAFTVPLFDAFMRRVIPEMSR